MTDLQEEISDQMTQLRRLAAMFKMTENLPTEDIELINARFPKLVECALHEILNERLIAENALKEIRRGTWVGGRWIEDEVLGGAA